MSIPTMQFTYQKSDTSGKNTMQSGKSGPMEIVFSEHLGKFDKFAVWKNCACLTKLFLLRYSCLEYLSKNKADYEAFREIAANSKEKLVKLGFPQFTIEDFHDTVSLRNSYP